MITDEVEICSWCDEPILPGEPVNSMPQLGPGDRVKVVYFHHECLMRSVAGSVAHQMKLCSCYGGAGEDEPHLTKRQAAKDAFLYWQAHQPEPA